MATSEDNKKVQLSKQILDMKFMKRTKDRVRKEEEDAEGQAMYSNQITEQMRKSGNVVFIETSISNCKNLIDGRLSFGGMNPDIERLMSDKYVKAIEEAERSKEKDVQDIDMAQGYHSSLVDTMGKKFQNKRQYSNRHSNRHSKKFMKPRD